MKKGFFFQLFFLSGLGTSCASYTQETAEIRSLYVNQQYQASLDKIESSSALQSSNNALLLEAEKSMIFDRMGNFRESRRSLIEADKIVDDLYTESISKTAASFLYNDSATDYSGEDYEKVAIHIMLAMSFIEKGDYASAQISARKINNKLHEINQNYEEGKNSYGEDAFARYLSGLIYQADGSFDDAIIEYRRALKLYDSSYQAFHNGGMPESLVKATYHLAGLRGRKSLQKKLKKQYKSILTPYILKRKKSKRWKGYGELIVIHEQRNIAIKTNKEFYLSIGGQMVRFSFPVIIPRGYYPLAKETGVKVDGHKFVSSENLQNMDFIAAKTLEDRKGRMMLKGMGRLIAKARLTHEAYKRGGALAGLAANLYSAVSETGDTRSWTLLPQRFSVTRMYLKAGKYKISIKSDGSTAEEKSIKIKAGKLLILRDK